jgi:transcriptional regulator with XRE-family HTH domain
MRTIDLAELGEAIAMLRGRQSQAHVSRRAGMSRASWSLYEQGRRRPREGNLEKILRGLGCTREQLDDAIWKVHRRSLVTEALELGFWPASALLEEGAAGQGEVPVAASARRSPRLSLAQPEALPPEVRAILARHVACLEDLLTYVLRRSS